MDTKKEEEEKVAVEVAGSGEMSASLMGMLGIAAPAPVVKQPVPVAVAGGKKGRAQVRRGEDREFGAGRKREAACSGSSPSPKTRRSS